MWIRLFPADGLDASGAGPPNQNRPARELQFVRCCSWMPDA